jgi:hypothetical protein
MGHRREDQRQRADDDRLEVERRERHGGERPDVGDDEQQEQHVDADRPAVAAGDAAGVEPAAAARRGGCLFDRAHAVAASFVSP